MKNLNKSIKSITFVFILFLFTTGLMAQVEIQVDDGGTAKFVAGTYTNTITSTTSSNSSTAQIVIGDASAAEVTFSGTMTGYYGSVGFYNGSKLNLGISTSCKYFSLGGSSVATILAITGSSDKAFGGLSGTAIDMGNKYGVLDLRGSTGNLTLTDGDVYFPVYNEATNPSHIKFDINTTTQKQLILYGSGRKIYTNETNGTIDVSKNFYFDMTNAVTGTPGNPYSFIFAKTKGQTLTTGTPLLSNSNELWSSPTVSVELNAGYYELKLNTNFSPLFSSTGPTTYYGTWLSGLAYLNGGANRTIVLEKSSSDMAGSRSITEDGTIGLKTFNITDVTYSLIISSSKTLSLTSSTGKYLGKINFGDGTSMIKVLNAGVLGDLTSSGAGCFSIDGSAAGIISFDGVTESIKLTNGNFNGKLGKVKISNTSTVTISN